MSDKIDQMWNSVEGLREGLTLAAREVERLTRVAQDALDALSRVEKERDEAREQWFQRGQQAAFVRAADVSGQRFLRNLPLHGAPTEEEWARFLAGVAHENVKPLVEEEMRAINYEQPLGPTRLDAAAEAEIERLTGVVRDFVGSAPHWRIFLTTRERIHADGLKLFDEAVTNARNLLETAGMRETK